ncbi:MAG: ribose-phosphate pyrophosphokinase [Gammaproteobacteria bacterium]|nr:ribose-phosphate pyrophosphokinase [Gammaproteobacteria bacterium]MDE0489696.1 ribose-phosphate pyrophosphokinase [Gammaproteobacteria bacterium]MXW20332.1 ribose-phosphate pyrophosphokinase [Gammaproteobacteria bacterium]MXZ27835.1 ribose-phosphate pyrophosphokinase [Gammaproteobacteria bacterium]MYF57655.1 ribose-phosphate pyrophosphokinase [Gammaproteobacteria bacterium]
MAEQRSVELPRITILSGNATPSLAEAIAKALGVRLGRAQVQRFSDGEISVEVLDNIRGRDVFIVQSTCPPVNDNLMELILLADACRRASAYRITAVVPYFGYSRQDRRSRATRAPISAKAVAEMVCAAGIDHLVTVDLHADQIQGFFSIAVDNVYASPVLLADAWKRLEEDVVVVSPDVGGVVRARALARRLDNTDLAIIDKRRPKPNVAEAMNIIGEVRGKVCVLIDDMIDTAGTLCQAAGSLLDEGAKEVVAYITHPVLSGKALERINGSDLTELVVTDTIPLTEEAAASGKIRQLSVAELLAETMRRISLDESVSSLYLD